MTNMPTLQERLTLIEQVLIQTRAQLAEAMAKNAELQAIIAMHNNAAEQQQAEQPDAS